ncbi:hypothetical protein KB973_001202 [Vibrio parahaemolyticus]|uniref:hypothetical protein n=1 Tax=Vibrio parahaemolyticus TaxID=670 RepID=UPI0011219108|nr:hypothetical protein [Vibrio parahaemolyticus]EHK0032266.1 hypothetical protein [Vibrio parahaemolyticus]TOQ83094.1 hypothetical protein CGG87_24080 [Vibrio parahaemolyticus]
MKVYILVEGECTELQLYPEWIQHLCPNLPHHKTVDEYGQAKNGFYIVSGFGYPSMLNHIENSIKDITQYGGDYFITILDAEEDSVEEKKRVINDCISQFTVPTRVNTHVIVQNRCVETILLGNPSKIPRVNLTNPFDEYFNYYNVIQNDPELMGCYTEGDNHAKFHLKYLKQAFKIKKIRYSKSNCRDVLPKTFLDGITARVAVKGDMHSFGEFITLFSEISEKIVVQDESESEMVQN